MPPTPSTRTGRQSRAQRASAKLAADPKPQPPTDPKDVAKIVEASKELADALNAATEEAKEENKPAEAAKPVAAIVGGGKGATGDNGHGFARAERQAKEKAAAEAAVNGEKPAEGAKPEEGGAATDKAAKPVKLSAAKAKKDAGPTRTSQNRIVAKAMVKACADMIEAWTPEVEKETGITKEFAAAGVASWLNYAPIPDDGWDERLPARSGAGGRGAKNRQAS